MTMKAKYPGRCRKCGSLFQVGTQIDWDRARGSVHHNPAECVRQVTAPPTAIDVSALVTFLAGAQASGLKWPKARFLGPDGRTELRLAPAGPNSRYPGVHVTLGDKWQGYIAPDGNVGGDRLTCNLALLDTLAQIATNTAEAAQAYGAVMGCCSFCGLTLTDAGSVEVGYGPVCAKKWGLPHQPKGTPMPTAVLS